MYVLSTSSVVTGIRCQYKFAINVALVRQFSVKKAKFPLGSGFDHFGNVTKNVHICFEVHIEKN